MKEVASSEAIIDLDGRARPDEPSPISLPVHFCEFFNVLVATTSSVCFLENAVEKRVKTRQEMIYLHRSCLSDMMLLKIEKHVHQYQRGLF